MSTYYESVIRCAYEDSDAYLHRFDDCKGNAFLMRSRSRDGFLEDKQNYVIWTTKDRACEYAEEVIKGFNHPICNDIPCLSRLFGKHGEEKMILANWVDSVFKSVEGFSSRILREPNVYDNNPPAKPVYVETPNPNLIISNDNRFWKELFDEYVVINTEFKIYDTLSEEARTKIKKDANDLCNKAVEYITTKAIMKNKRLKRGGRLDCVAIQGAVIEKSNGYDLKVEELPKVVSFIENFSINFLNYVNKYEKYLVDYEKNEGFFNTYLKRRDEYIKEKRDIEWISGSFVTCLKRGLIYWFEKGRRPTASSLGLSGLFSISTPPPVIALVAPPPLALPPPAPAAPVVAPPSDDAQRRRKSTIVADPREATDEEELVEAFRYPKMDFTDMSENYRRCLDDYMKIFNEQLEAGGVVRSAINKKLINDSDTKYYTAFKGMLEAIELLHGHFGNNGRDRNKDVEFYLKPYFKTFDEFTRTYAPSTRKSNEALFNKHTIGNSTDSRWELSKYLASCYDTEQDFKLYIDGHFNSSTPIDTLIPTICKFIKEKVRDNHSEQINNAEFVFTLSPIPETRQNHNIMILSILMYIKVAGLYLKNAPFYNASDTDNIRDSAIKVIERHRTPDEISKFCATSMNVKLSFDGLSDRLKTWLLVYFSTWTDPAMRTYCYNMLYYEWNKEFTIPELSGVFDKDKEENDSETPEEKQQREEQEKALRLRKQQEERAAKKEYSTLKVNEIAAGVSVMKVESHVINRTIDEVKKTTPAVTLYPPQPAAIVVPTGFNAAKTAPATTQAPENVYGFVNDATKQQKASTKPTSTMSNKLPLTLGNLPPNQVRVEASSNFDKTIKNFYFIPTDKDLEFSIDDKFINKLDSNFDPNLFSVAKQAELLGVDKNEILTGVEYYTNVGNPIYSSLLAKYKACEKVLTAYYRQYFITKNSGVLFAASDAMGGEINGLIDNYEKESYSGEGLIGKLFKSARNAVGSRKLVPEQAREILIKLCGTFKARGIEKSNPLLIAVDSIDSAIGQPPIEDNEFENGIECDDQVIKDYILRLKELLAFNVPSKENVGKLDEEFKRYLTLGEQNKKRLDLQAAKVAAEETTKKLNEQRKSDAYEILKKLHQVFVKQGFADMYAQSNDIMRRLKPDHVDDNTLTMDVDVTKAEIDNYFTELATLVSGFVGDIPGNVKLLKQTYDTRVKRMEAENVASIEKEFTQKQLAEDENKMATILYDLISVFSQMGYDKNLQETANKILIDLEKEAFMLERNSPVLVLSDVEIEAELKKLGNLKTNKPMAKMGITDLAFKYNKLEQEKKNKAELKKKAAELEHKKALAEIEAANLELKRKAELLKKAGKAPQAKAGTGEVDSGTKTPSIRTSPANSLFSTPGSRFTAISTEEEEEINEPPPAPPVPTPISAPTPAPPLTTDDPMNSARISNKRNSGLISIIQSNQNSKPSESASIENKDLPLEEEEEMVNISYFNSISPVEPGHERSATNPSTTPTPGTISPLFSQSDGSIKYEINLLDSVANALNGASSKLNDPALVNKINEFYNLISGLVVFKKRPTKEARQEALVLCRSFFADLINDILRLLLLESFPGMVRFDVEKWINYDDIVKKEPRFEEYRNAVVAFGELRDLKERFPNITTVKVIPVANETYVYSQISKYVLVLADGSDIIGRNFYRIFAAALYREVNKLEDFLNKGLSGYIIQTRETISVRDDSLVQVLANINTFANYIESEQNISNMNGSFISLVTEYNNGIHRDIIRPMFVDESSSVIVNHIKAIKAINTGTSELKDTWDLYKEFMDAYNQRVSIGIDSTMINDVGLMFEVFSKIPNIFLVGAYTITSELYAFVKDALSRLQTSRSFSKYFKDLFDDCSLKIEERESPCDRTIVPLEEDDGTDWPGTLGYVSLPSATSYLAEEQQIQIIKNSGILERMRVCKSADSMLIDDICDLFSKLAPNPNSLQYEFYNLVNGYVNIENVSEENVEKLRSNNKNPIFEFCYLIYQHPDLFILEYQTISKDTLKEIDKLYNEIKESFYTRKEDFNSDYKSKKVQIIKKLNTDLRIYRQNVREHKIISVSKTRLRLKEAYDNERTDFKEVYKQALDIFTFFKYVEYVYLPSESDSDGMFFNKLEAVLKAEYTGKKEECDALFELRKGLSGIYMVYKLNGVYELALRCHVKENLDKLIVKVDRALGVHKEFSSSSQLRPYIGKTQTLFIEGNRQLELVLRYLNRLEKLSDYEKNIYNVFTYKY